MTGIPMMLCGRYHDRVQLLYYSDDHGYLMVLAPSGLPHAEVARRLRRRT
jgi:hypothetical protein